MSKKEFKIGETFQLGFFKIKVVEQDDGELCEGCFINEVKGTCGDYKDLVGSCLKNMREDKTDVVFLKVEE